MPVNCFLRLLMPILSSVNSIKCIWMLAGLVVAAGAMVTSETTFFSALLALVVLVVPMIYGRSRAGQANG